MRDTIALDFDGVLAQRQGEGLGEPGSPVLGAKAFVFAALEQGYDIAVYSARPSGQIHDWLNTHGFPIKRPGNGKERGELYVSATKPPAIAYVDDRAVRFRGNFADLVDQIHEEPWWQQDQTALPKAVPPPKKRRIYRQGDAWFVET